MAIVLSFGPLVVFDLSMRPDGLYLYHICLFLHSLDVKHQSINQSINQSFHQTENQNNSHYAKRINKTDRHDITEILLKVALNTITLIYIGHNNFIFHFNVFFCL
jgi:hypothetical protein